MKKFSIIIATYSGLKTIVETFNSLLAQQPSRTEYEVIVVIDGPNKAIRRIVAAKEKEFESKGIPFTIKQFANNQGRFNARIAGAKLASFNQLLFVDDRVRLSKNYFRVLQIINKDIVMANVIEVVGKKTNIISQTLFFVRRRIYGSKFGKDFADYYINSSNFEGSPKGTTSLWITKQVFLDACKEVVHGRRQSNKYVNEDTKILRAVVGKGHNILRSSKLIAFYLPRGNLKDAIKHLYERGPRFVDYYIKPGTRFFPILALTYLVPIGIIIGLLFNPKLLYLTLVFIVALVAMVAIAISRNLKELTISLAGLSLIGLVFSLGIWKGTVILIKELPFKK
ncbi:hypothetical protein A2886_03030 [candidate division WWE3 bacterium RIFCSPHIGHO2_01_FULL_42_13]|uniref:Glycosyltransferase 2-like domain-containing protein n=1 Tax=candidate division WWE3 bacterium RIFCSPHIGHO2_01_FULL_42_13 TaxID=1802617 RepID=A0A1F4US84_UNCKA|nr:MAG: hypothetical protein A2886_03030 [candidate division WWE3 bacterium RIFCSPHIGHO2_01_FULL_42_13]